jgi:excisionase family DNA binding protein
MTDVLESALRQLLKNVAHEVAADLMEEWKASARNRSPQSTPADDSILLTPQETAKRLAISERHLHKLTRSGHLPRVRVGKCVRYNVETIQKWVRKSESAESPNIKSDTSTRASGASERKPRTKPQPRPKAAAGRNPVSKKASVSERESLKEPQPTSNGKPQMVQSEERPSPLSVLLNELGVSRSSLPPITNGELKRIAEVDVATIHGWLYLNRPLPEVALNRLKEHFRCVLKGSQVGE